jgi:hypothetical protein
VEEVRLVEQEEGAPAGGGDVLRAREEPLPEARQGRLGRVGGRVARPLARLAGELEEERRIPDLARAREELDAPRGRLGQAALEGLEAGAVFEPKGFAGHGRIAIRVRRQLDAAAAWGRKGRGR